MGLVTLETKKNKKQRVDYEPHRLTAARLKTKKTKKQRVNLEPPRPMAARLIIDKLFGHGKHHVERQIELTSEL